MNILINIRNQLIAEAIHQFLLADGSDQAMLAGESPVNGFIPQVILVDVTTVDHLLLSRYKDAKVLLIDTGMETEKLLSILLSHDIQGVLSTQMGLDLLKTALTAVTNDQIWIDSVSLKAVLEDGGAISKKGKIKGITQRHQEIIEYVCQGLSNKEIAQKLVLSEDTVKAHLNCIFRRLHITSREQLMALTVGRPNHRLARLA